MSVQFLSNTRARYSDGTGKPLTQGTVGVYVAGTSFGTLATIWDTVSKDTELTNPHTLDDAGEAEIWYDVEVDIQLKESGGAVVDTALGLNPNANNTASTGFNLATNGSFEVDSNNDGQPDGWTISPYTGSAIAITNDIVTHGVESLEFNTGGAGSGGGSATSSKFPVTEGSIVSVSWSFYATNAATVNTFVINWYDESGSLQGVGTLTDMPASGAVPTSWTSYQQELTAPAGATQGHIYIVGIQSSSSSPSSKAYFDGISIIQLNDLVTLDGTQTLTNKTLTNATISGATGTAAYTTQLLTVATKPVYGMVILDTPEELVNTATDPALTWATVDNATLSTAKATAAILRFYVTSAGAVAATIVEGYIRKTGSALTTDIKTRVCYAADKDSSAAATQAASVNDCTVNLDTAYDFDWTAKVTGGGTDLIAIHLVGYYV